MAEIPWWAWIGVGLFVAVSAGIMGGKVSWFAWIGLLFTAIGIGKVVYLFVLTPRKTEVRTSIPTPAQVLGSYCPLCRMSVLPTDRFCRYCGTRLR
ncbi:Uncharacterised protein [uncultured archaeon]|nr:Uncharacterised protein [uncultured archaeon]